MAIFGLQCQSGPGTPGVNGAAAISVSMQALSAASVDRVQITVIGPDIASPIAFDLVASGATWGATIGDIPSGIDRTFTGKAFDATGTLIYSGTASGVVITPGNTAIVVLVLQQATPPPPFSNTPPFIDSVVASAGVVAPGAQVAVAVNAHDADGDPLTFAWSATGGTFSNSTVTSPLWTAPGADGVYTLSIAVTDTKNAVRQVSFDIRVLAAAATGDAEIRATVNTWPTIQGVTVNATRVRAGETVSLAVAATDDDGNPLAFTWSDAGGDCHGSFSDATARNPTWTAPAANPAAGRCTLTVTVTDNQGGHNTGSIVVFIDGLETINFAPSIVGTFQGAPSAAPGHTIVFRVIASDPEGQPLAFTWTAAAGTLSVPVSTATTSEVVWTAPFICAPVAITVSVTDPLGSTTTRTFSAIADMPLADVDLPDGGFVDADCDGIDGDIDHAFFVSPTGNDAGTGTLLDPFRTIDHAVAQASTDPVRKQVLVSVGTYPESVTIPDGVGVFGQYDAAAGWSRSTTNQTIIDSPTSVGVRAANTTAAGYLEGMVVRTADANGASSSARAVVLENLGAAFFVRHDVLVAGRGATGAAGASGAPGVPGGFGIGGSGADGGGGGAPAPGCSGSGGPGGSGLLVVAGNGAPGPSGGGGPGGGGYAFAGPGGAGGPASSGSGGSVPVDQAQGIVSGNDWRARGGSSGSSGGCGGGGGGGGQGGCFCGFPLPCPTGGGGGGGGGSGGSGGTGGQGGGGSVGVFAINASLAVITDNTITTTGGGAGGPGGRGGSGGSGGGGADGFLCFAPGLPGAGGPGGPGGSGGTGGGGSGGAGGMSVGILLVSSPGLSASANIVVLGPGGAGGAGGNAAPAGASGIQGDQFSLP